jgi:hypothetical protein
MFSYFKKQHFNKKILATWKQLFWIASTFSSIGLGRFFEFFLFLICLKEVFVGRQR